MRAISFGKLQVADAELLLTERAQYCQLADTERRAFWMHRNAREVLCQASAEAEQAGNGLRLQPAPSLCQLSGSLLPATPLAVHSAIITQPG